MTNEKDRSKGLSAAAGERSNTTLTADAAPMMAPDSKPSGASLLRRAGARNGRRRNAKRAQQKRRSASKSLRLWRLGLIPILAFIALHFFRGCPPPADPTLIEYYINGRDSWAESMATIQALQKSGYKVKVYAASDIPTQPPAMEDRQVLLDKLHKSSQRSPRYSRVFLEPPFEYTRVEPCRNLHTWRDFQMLIKRLAQPPRGRTRPLLQVNTGDIPAAIEAWVRRIPVLLVKQQTGPRLQHSAMTLRGLLTSLLDWNWFSRYVVNFQVRYVLVPEPQFPFLGVREQIKDMAVRRHGRLLNYQKSRKKLSGEHRKLIVSSFRRFAGVDATIQTVADAGMDVAVFGSPTRVRSPNVIPIRDAALLVPMVGIGDGVIAAFEDPIIAECIYAQIPTLILYNGTDRSPNLEVFKNPNLRSDDGLRLVFTSSVEDPANNKDLMNPEIMSFLDTVLQSNASASFYANTPVATRFSYVNDLLNEHVSHVTRVQEGISQVEGKEGCRARL